MRNTIEMQSVTALAHLNSLVVFIIDLSEECGYALKDQLSLFESMWILFKQRPCILGLNKIDIMPVNKLGQEEQ